MQHVRDLGDPLSQTVSPSDMRQFVQQDRANAFLVPRFDIDRQGHSRRRIPHVSGMMRDVTFDTATGSPLRIVVIFGGVG